MWREVVWKEGGVCGGGGVWRCLEGFGDMVCG